MFLVRSQPLLVHLSSHVTCPCGAFFRPLEVRALACNLAQGLVPVRMPCLKHGLHALQVPFGLPRFAAAPAHLFNETHASGDTPLTLTNVAVHPSKGVPWIWRVGHGGS